MILYKYDENGNVRKKYKLEQTTSGGASTGSSVVLTDPNSADKAFGYEWSSAGSNEIILAEYKWYEENRLKEAITGNTKVKFLYNAGGERTVKYAINQIEVLYVDKLYQRQIGLNSDCITKHIFVGETRVVSKVTYENLENNAPVEKENVYYYHQDHLGGSNFITDYKGNIYEHIEYTPYGETWVEESNDTMSYINYKFTSKEFDEESGLYYFSAKYYDPKECRSFLKSYNALFYIFI